MHGDQCKEALAVFRWAEGIEQVKRRAGLVNMCQDPRLVERRQVVVVGLVASLLQLQKGLCQAAKIRVRLEFRNDGLDVLLARARRADDPPTDVCHAAVVNGTGQPTPVLEGNGPCDLIHNSVRNPVVGR